MLEAQAGAHTDRFVDRDAIGLTIDSLGDMDTTGAELTTRHDRARAPVPPSSASKNLRTTDNAYAGKVIDIAAGQSVSLHHHGGKTETIIVLSGTGVAELGPTRSVEVVLDGVRQHDREPVGSDLRRQVALVHQIALPRSRRRAMSGMPTFLIGYVTGDKFVTVFLSPVT
jgi:hypothetical protein